LDSVDPMMGLDVRDEDTDSLATIPLAILPFDSVTLRGLRMVKNNGLESVVQMFDDDKTGAGHIKPRDLKRTIGEISPEDFGIVNKVSELHSFDVYCLRIALRDHGIQVNDTRFLKLSPSMQSELDRYVGPFTARLIKAIYGDDSPGAANPDVSQLLKDADVNQVREKLKLIAGKIQIDLAKVPQFLEDYGDIYLSIAYYRNRLDELEPIADDFVAGMEAITSNHQLQGNTEIVAAAKKMRDKVNKMREVLRGRFQLFTQSTNEMWDDMNADRFADFKQMVEENHAALGGLLCKLGVKLDAWHAKFPSRDTAGPNRMADFLMTDMRPGF